MPAIDKHSALGGGRGGMDSPYTSGEAVTPHDTNEFATMSRAIFVGGAGNIAVVMWDGTVLTLASVPAGSMLPLRAKRINATGTTATNIVAFN